MGLVIEDIPESEQLKQERQKLDSERQKQQQKQEEFLKPFLDNFCYKVRTRMSEVCSGTDIERYIQENTVEKAIENVSRCLSNIKDADDEERYVFTDNFLEHAFYLYCAVELEYKRQEELEKQEKEKQEELEDLENAKPVFEILKTEVLKSGCGFDEWTISIYIKDMLEIARKHKVDLGVKENIVLTETKDE